MQAVRRRLIAAVGVVAVGTVSALPFYRFSSTSDSTDSTVNSSSTGSPTIAAALQIPAGEASAATVTSNQTRNLPSAGAIDSAKPPDARASQKHLTSAPQLPNRRPAAQEKVPPAAQIRRVGTDPVSFSASELHSLSKNSQQRSHWITDGDTLEELARRFLGDRSRWREIREANREILTTDDILPIGKEIRIPAREVDHSQAANPSTGEPNGLVPIPWYEK